jgi:signal transduction histidine kinase
MSTQVAIARAAEDRGRNAYAAAGLLAAGSGIVVLSTWAVAKSSVLLQPHGAAILRALVIATYVAAGTYMWWCKPERRLGLLVAVTGFVFASTSLVASSDALVFTLGRIALAVFIVYYAYVILCFPGDRLVSDRDRAFIRVLAGATVLVWPIVLLFSGSLPAGGPLTACDSHCPENALQITTVPDRLSDLFVGIANGVTVAAIVGIGVRFVAKSRSPLRLRRRAVEPVTYAVIAQIVGYAVYALAQPTGGLFQTLRFVTAGSAIAIPLAMLAGQARARSYAAGSIGQLVSRMRGERVTPPRMEGILRHTLGDPSLELSLWDGLRSRFVSVQGDVVDPTVVANGRAVTRVLHDGRPIAALEHSAALDEAAGIVEGLAETALMLQENTHLVDELRDSRARVVASADHERHRLERDLHDGAQQRLFLLEIKLARLRQSVADREVVERIEEIEADAAAALEELRVLAHGIYPTVLVERGIAEALRAFAVDSPVRVRIVDDGIGRCSPAVEAAVYFCALEALQNVAKHAGPSAEATVELHRIGDRIDLGVTDDGLGFHDGSRSDGIGLVTMRDRIGAVGGEVEIVSKPREGVTVHAIVPEAPLHDPKAEQEPAKWQSA